MLDDEERKKEYLLAKSVGAEIMADEMIDKSYELAHQKY
jgi:hypothetical protein